MDVLEAIQKRRSVRHYKPDPIPEEVITKLINAVRMAPSGGNCQPWKFVVVQNAETKKKLAEACMYATPRDEVIHQGWISDAPVLIVACGYERDATVRYYDGDQVIIGEWIDFAREMQKGPINFESELLIDLAIALDHLTLAAVEEGLGTCWVTGMNERKVKEILGVPVDMRTPGLMALGFPERWPEPRQRKPLDEVLFFETYEEKNKRYI